MLVLTRREEEKIIATTTNGEVITFVILNSKGGQVTVGVSAPPSVRVNREEVEVKILQKQREATGN